jgi:hypothetical protein
MTRCIDNAQPIPSGALCIAHHVRRTIMRKALIGLIGAIAVLGSSAAMAQSARDVRGPAPVVPLASEPAAKIVIDPPLADALSQGRVVIQYRAEHLRIVPVFGPAALEVSPRLGHIHVTVDDAPWRWADASGEPLIINGLPPGPHKVLVELVNANHQTLDQSVVNFVIPEGMVPHSHH